MLEVPTHVDVRIIQTDFWKIDGDELKLIPEATSRNTQIDPVFTEQMFLMDPKRPAEGTGQFNFKFFTDTPLRRLSDPSAKWFWHRAWSEFTSGNTT